MRFRSSLFMIAALGLATAVSAEPHINRMPSDELELAVRNVPTLDHPVVPAVYDKRDDNTPDGSTRSSTPQGSQSNAQNADNNAGADAPKSGQDPTNENLGSQKSGAAGPLKGSTPVLILLAGVLVMSVL